MIRRKGLARNVMLSVGLLLGLAMSSIHAEAPRASITRIEEIRRLSRADSTKGIPVRVSGTCIFEASGEFFVHDGAHGIWVSSITAKSRGLLRDASGLDGLAVGRTVEIDGVTDPGGYAPQIVPTVVRQTGTADLPRPVRISAERLVAGSEDGQWVQLEGVVQDVQVLADRTVCALVAEGVDCWISLSGRAGRDLPKLVDARVRVVGAFAPDFNNRSEALLPKVISSASGCIEIIQPPRDDPFGGPRLPLDRLRAFSPDASLFHRKVTSGVVTFVRAGEFFFLRDGATSVRVASTAIDLQPGWRVDVAGFVDNSQHLTALKSGMVRKTGEEAPPPAERVTPMELLRSASWQSPTKSSSSDLSGHTVMLHGLIRRVDRSSSSAPVAVWIESEDVLFPATLPPRTVLDEAMATSWRIGAEVRIKGACELDFRGRPDPLGLYDPVGFHVWLASPNDLEIIRPAPWWTARRLAIALSATGLAALIAIGFVAVLRRQVGRQVGIIARELEANAVASERERMARDLHDTLEQQLTGVAMQLEGLAKSSSDQSSSFNSRLTLVSRMIQHSREEARRSVWDLRNRVLENHGLAAAIESLAASADIDGGPKVVTCISGSRAHLSPSISYQLLRVAQEALANALKHARASNIVITLDMAVDHYLLMIRDDGRGFDPGLTAPPGAPHFGLMGMRERAARIGAVLNISSNPGHGCTVSVQLPIHPR
jgi:signal transduction histidine kinase